MFRVLSAQVAHETNTFSLKPTTLADYRSRALYFGDAIRPAFENTNTEIGAHLAAAELFGLGHDAARGLFGDALRPHRGSGLDVAERHRFSKPLPHSVSTAR